MDGLLSPATSLRQMPAELGATLYDAIYGSPFGNDLLLDFAGELLNREQLGQRNATDLLSVSFSSNDSVGHTYGPDSPQVRDIALRTDRSDRPPPGSGRQERRPPAHARGLHDRPRRGAGARVAAGARALPGGRMTTKELFDPIQQALARGSATASGCWARRDRRRT